MEKAIKSTGSERMKEIARELHSYGLAIALPHMHTEEGVGALPRNTIQYEKDLQVSFPKSEAELGKTFPAMWRFDEIKNELVVCGRCECTD